MVLVLHLIGLKSGANFPDQSERSKAKFKQFRMTFDVQLKISLMSLIVNCRTPVHAAAFNDQVDCLQLLLARGGNVDSVDQSGRTPLVMAADNGHAGSVGEYRVVFPNAEAVFSISGGNL